MQVSPEGRAALEAREGRRLLAYRDSVGVWTIGVGHTGRMSPPVVHAGMRITEAQCDAFLEADLAPTEAAINALGLELTQNQFDACASLSHNIGVHGFVGSSVVKQLKLGNFRAAADDFLMWEKPAELKARREAERKQFLTPDGPSSSVTAGTPKPMKTQAEEPSSSLKPALPDKPVAPAAATPASHPAATKETSSMFNLSSLAGLLTMAQAGFSVAHEYSAVAPQLASGASKIAKDGSAVATGISKLASDVKGGHYSDTPEDVTAILGKFGEIVGDVEAMVAPAAEIVGKASALPSVAGIKALSA